LEEEVFSGDTSLKTAMIKSGLDTIPKKVFYGCEKLESAVLPEGLTTIDEQAFYNCAALKSLDLPSSLESINYAAFNGCSSLTDVAIKEGLTMIDEYAFYKCSSLESIVLPSTLDNLNYAAFASCTSLSDVTISDGLETIGYSVFLDSSNIKEINIPASITTINEWAFSGVDNAANINVDPANQNYSDIDGVLYDKEGKTLIQYLKSKGTHYDIPEGVVKIAKGAFMKTGIETVTMPSSLEEVGFSAFENCQGITDIEVSPNVTILNHYAFYKAGNLERIVLPDGLTTIGNNAFKRAEKLANIIIPNTVTSIGDSTFKECRSLTEITIPNSVQRIGKEVFVSCDNLKKVIVDNVAGELQIGDNAIPDSVEVVYLRTEVGDDQKVTMSDEVKAFYVDLFNENDGDYKNLTDEAKTSYAPLTTDHVFTVADMKMLKNFYVGDRNVDDSLVAPLKYAINLESFIVELDDSAHSRDLVNFSCLKNCKKVKKVYYLNNDLNMDSESEDADGSGTCSIHGCGNTKDPLKDISALTTMSGLEDLRINMTELRDLMPINNLWLKTIIVPGNKIESVNDSIGNMTSLEVIDIGHNRVTSIMNFEHLSNLKTAYVNDNGIRDISYFSKVSGLEALSINGNPLPEDYMTSIRTLSKVNRLNIADISSDDFEWMKTFVVRDQDGASTIVENNARVFTFGKLKIELEATQDMINDGVLTIKNPLKGLVGEPVAQNTIDANQNVNIDGDDIKITLSNPSDSVVEVSYPVYTKDSSKIFGGKEASISGKVTLKITIDDGGESAPESSN
jgi:hypothetical protein